MILIGENINIMSRTIGPALKERNPKPIQEFAIKQAENGVDMLDLNIGPARKEGEEIMEWLVKTVQEVVDIPLSLDSTNPKAIEAGLKVAKITPLINSVTAQKERLEQTLPLAQKYQVPYIAVLLSDTGIPRDMDERVSIFFEILTASQSLDIPLDLIWVDPIIFPVSADQKQIVYFVNFLEMLPELAGQPIKTACGLSNISNGSPEELRPLLNQVYLAILMNTGNQTSAIVDGFDKKLINMVKTWKDLNNWIATLPQEEQIKVQKTIQVLKNEALYCHSWLEV